MTTLVEDDNKVNLKAGSPPEDGTLEDKGKDDVMAEEGIEKDKEEDGEEGGEDIAKEEVKGEANFTHFLEGIEPWEKNESVNPVKNQTHFVTTTNVIFSSVKGIKAAPAKERQPCETGIPVESESEKVASEHLSVGQNRWR